MQKQIQKVLIIIKRHLVNQIGFNDIKENCVKKYMILFFIFKNICIFELIKYLCYDKSS